jgi:hypothetical protein
MTEEYYGHPFPGGWGTWPTILPPVPVDGPGPFEGPEEDGGYVVHPWYH